MNVKDLHNYTNDAGETWAPGDLCAYAERGTDPLCLEHGIHKKPNHLLGSTATPEPLMFLGASHKGATMRTAWFVSARFGLCWRFVWTDDANGFICVQHLDGQLT